MTVNFHYGRISPDSSGLPYQMFFHGKHLQNWMVASVAYFRNKPIHLRVSVAVLSLWQKFSAKV